MRKTLLVLVAALALVVGGAGQAQALTITPTTGCITGANPACSPITRWEGDSTSNADVQDALNAIFTSLALSPLPTELYKSNVGGVEEKALSGNYDTDFDPDVDPSGALITHTGTAIVAAPSFLLVKDGNQTPAWYLFYMSALGWNGTETLSLEGFWPNQGAISHISLYGTEGSSDNITPEPAMLALFGTALAIVGARLRRRQ
jgi:hypothetical protein